MAAPRAAPKTKPGFVSWGDTYGDMAHLTEPQMRAFEVLMRDAPKTTNGTARKGRSTYVCDHEVVLSALAVCMLEKRGLVEEALSGVIGGGRWLVVPTVRGQLAWMKRRAESGPSERARLTDSFPDWLDEIDTLEKAREVHERMGRADDLHERMGRADDLHGENERRLLAKWPGAKERS